jgi:hypothetical protein
VTARSTAPRGPSRFYLLTATSARMPKIASQSSCCSKPPDYDAPRYGTARISNCCLVRECPNSCPKDSESHLRQEQWKRLCRGNLAPRPEAFVGGGRPEDLGHACCGENGFPALPDNRRMCRRRPSQTANLKHPAVDRRDASPAVGGRLRGIHAGASRDPSTHAAIGLLITARKPPAP